jgi:hypothetical protein
MAPDRARAALGGAAFFSAQPIELRVTALVAAVVLPIVGALMVRLAGPLEVSVPQAAVKATVDAIPRETLLLAQQAVAQVLPGEDADKQAVAAEAVLQVLRRDRAAEVLAEVKTLLFDATPDRLGFNVNDRSPAILADLRERQKRIRVPLLTVTGGNTSPSVHNLGVQLEEEMANTLFWTSGSSSTCSRTRTPSPARQDAIKHHTEALRLLDQLVKAIQRA